MRPSYSNISKLAFRSKENSGYRAVPSLEMQPPFIKRTEDKLYENDDDYYSMV